MEVWGVPGLLARGGGGGGGKGGSISSKISDSKQFNYTGIQDAHACYI